jgi:hypothetical protein
VTFRVEQIQSTQHPKAVTESCSASASKSALRVLFDVLVGT